MENITVKQELNISSIDEDMNYVYDGSSYNLEDKENIKTEEISVKLQLSEDMQNIEDDFRTTNELPLRESTNFYTNKSDISTNRNTEEDIPAYLYCDICKQRRFTNYGLMRHRIEHSLDTYYTCLICFKTYSRRTFLISHIVRHSQIKQKKSSTKNTYTCEVCSKCFNCPSNFNKHKRTHIKEKRYKCDICNRQYTQNSYLTIHKREHTGEKPFNCDICHKQYTNNNMLTQHKRAHHGLIDDSSGRAQKLFECDSCPKRFTFENSMKRHKLVLHSNMESAKCQICDKKFKRFDDLQLHIRVHMGEKPFECKICHERFAVKSEMNKHKRRHSN